jgi:hypothetical protein
MGLATILAWKLKFPQNEIPLELMDEYTQQQEQQGPPIIQQPNIATESGIPESTVFAVGSRRKLPEWVVVIKHFKTPNCIAFLLVAWLMGIGIGLIFTFLFWHLQVNTFAYWGPVSFMSFN